MSKERSHKCDTTPKRRPPWSDSFENSAVISWRHSTSPTTLLLQWSLKTRQLDENSWKRRTFPLEVTLRDRHWPQIWTAKVWRCHAEGQPRFLKSLPFADKLLFTLHMLHICVLLELKKSWSLGTMQDKNEDSRKIRKPAKWVIIILWLLKVGRSVELKRLNAHSFRVKYGV